MTKTKVRGRTVVLSLVGAIALAFITFVGGDVGAASASHRLSGTFDFQVAASPGCPDPTCVTAAFRGGIRGSGEGPATAIVPAQPPTNLILEGLLTIRTSSGDLRLAGTTVLNPDPASDGEIAFLFKIVGGTGAFAPASGYIMATATADVPGAVVTNASYTGKLILP